MGETNEEETAFLSHKYTEQKSTRVQATRRNCGKGKGGMKKSATQRNLIDIVV